MRGDVITMSHFFNKMVGLYLPSCSKLDQDQIWTAKKPWGAISIDLTMTGFNYVIIKQSNSFWKTAY